MEITEQKKTKHIKEIISDLDDINYVLKNYDLDKLSPETINNIYSNISNVWLYLSKLL